jgi:vacuolar protein sorting-associated protein 13A/C
MEVLYLVPRLTSSVRLSIRNPLAVVLNALTMTVGNINDAPLEMNALAIKDMRLTMPELQNRVTYHYRQDVIRQLYRILGSADFIGNPVGLFTNVSSGVADIFYEPFHGVVMHGNGELGIGIAKVLGKVLFLHRRCLTNLLGCRQLCQKDCFRAQRQYDKVYK